MINKNTQIDSYQPLTLTTVQVVFKWLHFWNVLQFPFYFNILTKIFLPQKRGIFSPLPAIARTADEIWNFENSRCVVPLDGKNIASYFTITKDKEMFFFFFLKKKSTNKCRNSKQGRWRSRTSHKQESRLNCISSPPLSCRHCPAACLHSRLLEPMHLIYITTGHDRNEKIWLGMAE